MGGTIGTCEVNGFCSFPDPTCASGSRFGTASGSVSGQCVGDQMMGSDSGSGSVEPPGITAWTAGPPLPKPRYSHAMVVNGNDVYAIGGILGSTALADVSLAHVDQNAIEPQLAIQSWISTTPLPAARRAFGAAFYAGYIYVVAGAASPDSTADVSAAMVNADGTLGIWAPTTALPVTLRAHAVTSSGSHLYVVGGKQSGSVNTAKNFVLRAEMSGGTVSSWQSAATLDTTVFDAGAVAVNGYLYVVGGCASGKGACNPPLDMVQVAKINSDGSLGPFAHTTALPMGRSHHAVAASASKQELFVLGGSNATAAPANANGDVLVAHIYADGTVGPWRTAPSLTKNESRSMAAVVGSFLIDIQAYVQIAKLQ